MAHCAGMLPNLYVGNIRLPEALGFESGTVTANVKVVKEARLRLYAAGRKARRGI